MAESLNVTTNSNKEVKFQELLPQLKALIEGESNLIANLANIKRSVWMVVGRILPCE